MTAKEFIYSLPGRANPDVLADKETCFHFHLSGDGGGQFTVAVADGKMDVQDGLVGEPKCEVKASDENFMKVIRGELNPMMALMMGKVKITNQGEMLKYAKVFGLM